MPYDAQTGLPFAAGSHESYHAAQQAAPTRGAKTARYLQLLAKWGPKTDPEAAAALKLPLQSICSIRNGCIHTNLVEKGETRRLSAYGHPCAVWVITRAGKRAVAAMTDRA